MFEFVLHVVMCKCERYYNTYSFGDNLTYVSTYVAGIRSIFPIHYKDEGPNSVTLTFSFCPCVM